MLRPVVCHGCVLSITCGFVSTSPVARCDGGSGWSFLPTECTSQASSLFPPLLSFPPSLSQLLQTGRWPCRVPAVQPGGMSTVAMLSPSCATWWHIVRQNQLCSLRPIRDFLAETFSTKTLTQTELDHKAQISLSEWESFPHFKL